MVDFSVIGNTDYAFCKRIVKSLGLELFNSYPRREFRRVIQSPLFGDRVYGYECYIRDSCASVFRSHGGDVYYFNGNYWCPLSDVLLEQCLNESLVLMDINRSDLIKARSNILRAAKQGASMSRLSLSRYVVGFRNGVYDFSDVENPVYHSFDERMDVVDILPYDYDPLSTCPMWESFLSSILTPVQVSILQKFLSLGIVPRDSSTRKIEKSLWLVGSGANGKSVIFEVVKSVYGDGNVSSMSLHNLIKDGDDGARFRAAVVGKIFNYCTEMNTSDISRYEGNFKSLCSGEEKEYRKIGGNVELTRDIPYLIFNMNKKPSNRSMGEAFMRRLLLIHFRTTVSRADMRLDLVSELCKELSGIRNWLIRGYIQLKNDGFKFTATEESVEETENYLLENGQTIQLFLRKRGYRSNRYSGRWNERPKYVSSQSIYNDYVGFCERKMYDAESLNMFGREMTRLGFEKRKNSSSNAYAVFCDNEISYALNV